jgi:hypothetical protein
LPIAFAFRVGAACNNISNNPLIKQIVVNLAKVTVLKALKGVHFEKAIHNQMKKVDVVQVSCSKSVALGWWFC